MNKQETVIDALESAINKTDLRSITVTVPMETAVDALILLEKQEWISVNDRLPNCNGCYLVWRPHFYIDKGMPSICYFDGSSTWHDSYGVDFTRTLAPEDVSHWKPLPVQP